jgi:hypothetical protein
VLASGDVSEIEGRSAALGSKKFVPVIATMDDGVWLYSTDAGLTLVIVGTGGATVKPPTRLPLNPPDAAGFVTVTVYAPGVSASFGHHMLIRFAVTWTNGRPTVAVPPATVVPLSVVAVVGLVTWTVALSTKFVPSIEIARLSVTP